MLSDAPTRAKMRSTIASFAPRAPARSEPICAITTISATCRRYVDLPPMFGPVITTSNCVAAVQDDVVGHERRQPLPHARRPGAGRRRRAMSSPSCELRLDVVADGAASSASAASDVESGQRARGRRRMRGACSARRRCASASNRLGSRVEMRSSAVSTLLFVAPSAPGVTNRSPPAIVCLRCSPSAPRAGSISRSRCSNRTRGCSELLSDWMPVRARSASSIAAMTCLPDLADGPQLVERPICAVAREPAFASQRRRGVDQDGIDPGAHVRQIVEPRNQGDQLRRLASPRTVRTRGMTARESFSPARSRVRRFPAQHVPAAVRGPACAFTVSRNFPRSVDRNASSSTASRRSWMASTASSGLRSHERRSRAPGGVTVRSSTSSNEPSRPSGLATISR